MTLRQYLGRLRNSLKAGRPTPRPRKRSRRLFLEPLEDRTLFSISLVGVPNWLEQGPGPIFNGNNVEVIPNRPQDGAINQMAIDPTNPDRIFVATVNGGIWRTTTARNSAPSWTPLTDQLPSLSIGSIAFSPIDTTENTLFAGVARFSSGFGDGGPLTGLLRTTDGGNTWVATGGTTLNNKNVGRIIPTTVDSSGNPATPTTQVVLVNATGGVYRSTDGGATFGAVPVLAGNVNALVADPSSATRFYAAIPGAGNGIFISNDSGNMWTPDNGDISATVISQSNFIEMAVHSSGVVFACVFGTAPPPPAGGTQTVNLFRSTNQGTNWTLIGDAAPRDTVTATTAAVQGGQMTADPSDSQAVFLSGGVANVAGASRPSGRVWHAKFDAPAGSQWQILVGTNGTTDGSSPHPDSRDLQVDSAGNLWNTSDGGIYRLLTPNTPATRKWVDELGNIRVTEFYSVAYDSVNHVIFGGSQDNGSPEQQGHESPPGTTGNFQWNDQTGADGGHAEVFNDLTNNVSIHYGTEQNLGFFIRQVFDNTNTPTTSTLGLVVNGTGGITLTAGLPGSPAAPDAGVKFDNTVQFINPYAVNAVDSNRLVIATNFLYESTDRGDTLNPVGGLTDQSMGAADDDDTTAGLDPDEFAPKNPIGLVDAATFPPESAVTGSGIQSFSPIAYGGMSGGVPNPNVLWIGAGGNLLLRTSGTGLPTAVAAYTAAGGATVLALVLDPTDWHTCYVLDTNANVWRTTDTGTTWTKLTGTGTGSLTRFSTDMRTIEFVRSGSSIALLVGGRGGLYRTINPGANPVWTRFGEGLPNTVVHDVHYDSTDDVLLVGTYGRGAWTIPNAGALIVTPAVLQINGDTDFPNENDTIRLVRNAINPLLLDVFLNNPGPTPTLEVPLASLQQINVNGLGIDNDTLIVDSSNGLISVPNGINYAGGTGFSTLQLVQSGGVTQFFDTYSPGPNIGQGTDVISGPSGTQTVFFQNLAPVLDLVPASTLTVNGTPANNAISYTAGLMNPSTDGLVTVDNLESIEFANKVSLFILSGLGTDTISLNNAGTPTSLSSINVIGGDPNANDALLVTGVGATVAVDTFGMTITGATGTGGGVPISYGNIHSLSVTAGASTTLAVSGSTTYVYTPATAANGGSIQTDLLPISFSGFGAGTTLALTGAGGNASLVANGTTANDTFTVAATTGNVTLAGRATISPTSIANLTVNGLDGGDTFNVAGPQPYTSITLGGGGALAGDVANLTGDGTPVVANLGGTTASVGGGDLSSVSLPGIETLNLRNGAGSVTLVGTPGPDVFTVNPTGAGTATAQVGGLAPLVNVTTTGALTVNGGGGSDTLIVNGTSGPDTINVSGTQVAVNSLLPVNYLNIAALQVNGLAGSDTFNVTSSATVPINIDGGDPAGATPGDAINVVTAPSDTVTYTPGPTGDQGSVQVSSNQPISFAHIVSLGVNGAAAAVIDGTNANDVITVIARDSSYVAGADGVQDFTVTVNNGANFLFLNTPSLTINALAGGDQISLKAPAPNLAAWNETVTVDGGPNAAVGGQLVVTAPGTSQATYTPASATGGALAVNNSNGLVANVTITNVQVFRYDGQAGNDTLTMVGNAAANLFTLKPGAVNDAGILSMDSNLPVAFQNLGGSGKVVVNGNGGADTLVYYGVAANDTFTVASNPLGGQVNLNARVPVITEAIPTLTLQGVAGGDTFTLVPTIAASPYTTLNLQAGNLAAGDVANLTAAVAADLSVSGQVVNQGGKTVAGSGLANINLNGAGNRLIYNSVAGPTENINVLASPTPNQGQVSVPGVVLVTFVNVPIIAVNGIPADNDTVTFTGTLNTDIFWINLAAPGTIAHPVLKVKNTLGTTLLTLQNYTGFPTLNIEGLSGADTFNVYTNTTAPGGGRQIFINEQLPAGKKKLTSVLNVFYVFPKPKIIHSTSTQDPDAGLVSLKYATASFLIQFDGIPTVTIKQGTSPF